MTNSLPTRPFVPFSGRRAGRACAALVAVAGITAPLAAQPAVATPPEAPASREHRTRATGASETLPLGPASSVETRTTRTVQRGVTYTHITRGAANAALRWVVEMNIPAASTSPDPTAGARSVQDRAAADALVTALKAAGIRASAQAVRQPAVADMAAGVIGYRVRLEQTHADKAAADKAVAAVVAAGFSGRSWYTGWDGGEKSAGPWNLDVITIDPTTFRGTLDGTFGPDLEKRETVSQLVAFEKARVGVNAGFFVMDPASGAEGDPAGVAVFDGKFLSEPTSGRPALVLQADASGTRVTRPEWSGTLRWNDRSTAIDGVNRVPGMIRNCGGEISDTPTALPLHDVTCTDASEIVTFTPEFGAATPAGAGAEAVLDARGTVVDVRNIRGVKLKAGQRSVQGIGADAAVVASMAVGTTVAATNVLDLGAPLTQRTTVLNGGPQLVAAGRTHITQKTDGMNHLTNPSFDYGWVLQRNPRTIAGVDGQGRTVLITADGRQLGALGLSIPEAAAVARSLGLREAINLDGGGSTTMVVDGARVNSSSDATGERPVGDAIVIK